MLGHSELIKALKPTNKPARLSFLLSQEPDQA